jgi:hypothetical protein
MMPQAALSLAAFSGTATHSRPPWRGSLAAATVSRRRRPLAVTVTCDSTESSDSTETQSWSRHWDYETGTMTESGRARCHRCNGLRSKAEGIS